MDRGQQLLTSRPCGACHTVRGVQGVSGRIGPELSSIAAVAGQRKPGLTAVEYLRESIVDPNTRAPSGYRPGNMPRLPLSDQEVKDLVALLMTRE